MATRPARGASCSTYCSETTSIARAGSPVHAQQWLDALLNAGYAADAISFNSVPHQELESVTCLQTAAAGCGLLPRHAIC